MMHMRQLRGLNLLTIISSFSVNSLGERAASGGEVAIGPAVRPSGSEKPLIRPVGDRVDESGGPYSGFVENSLKNRSEHVDAAIRTRVLRTNVRGGGKM